MFTDTVMSACPLQNESCRLIAWLRRPAAVVSRILPSVMSVEMLPVIHSSSSRRKMGPRGLFQWVIFGGVLCVIGWYFISRSLLLSRISAQSRMKGVIKDPLLVGLEQEIEARKLVKGNSSFLAKIGPRKEIKSWQKYGKLNKPKSHDRSVGRSIDWLIGWLARRLIVQLFSWLIVWLIDCLIV